MDDRSVEEHHARIAHYALHDGVPESVITQYEVARNLYLHAWAVYRFYMVAQHQALIVLEFAVKERFGQKKLGRFARNQGLRPGLAACIKYLAYHQYVRNSDFDLWWHRRKMHSQEMFQLEVIEKMKAEGLKEYSYEPDDIDLERYAFDYDYLSVLAENLPPIRNEHAHGSSMLDRQVEGIFEIVSTIINKIYDPLDS